MKRTRRKEREFTMRREAILAEAEKIFSVKGYHNVTMAEIAAAAGFSTGALYLYFESKEALYTDLIIEKLTLMYSSVFREVAAAKSIFEKLDAYILAHLKFVEKNTNFCRIFLRGENELSPLTIDSLRERLKEDYLDSLARMEDIIKTGIKKRLLRNLTPRDIATTLSHLVLGCAEDWLTIDAQGSLVSKKDMILDIFLNGVKKHEV